MSSTEMLPRTRRVSFDENVKIIADHTMGETKQDEEDGESEKRRRASKEELDIEMKVQQKIEETKRTDAGVKQVRQVMFLVNRMKCSRELMSIWL